MPAGVTRIRISARSEEHTSELQSQSNLVCRLLLEKKKKTRGPCRVGQLGVAVAAARRAPPRCLRCGRACRAPGDVPGAPRRAAGPSPAGLAPPGAGASRGLRTSPPTPRRRTAAGTRLAATVRPPPAAPGPALTSPRRHRLRLSTGAGVTATSFFFFY